MENQFYVDWLENLKAIWEKRLPEKITDICDKKFAWYESPYSKPITKSANLVEEWRSVLKQKDIKFSYNILAITDSICITHWEAKFIRIPLMKVVEMDGVFKIKLNENGKCAEFRQWFNQK